MGNQIIKQPDGKFAIFSSESDTIVEWDATEQEVMDYFAELAAEWSRRTTERLLGHVKAGHPQEAYYQFAVTWDEALETDRDHGGEVWREFQS